MSDWSIDDVSNWMAVVSLLPYVDIFRRYNVDGNALSSLSDNSLQEMGICDEFHREAILAAVRTVCSHEEVGLDIHEQMALI